LTRWAAQIIKFSLVSEHLRDMVHTSEKGAVSAKIHFVADSAKWEHEKPYLILSTKLGKDLPQTNVSFVQRTCIIKDLRCNQPETALGSDLFKLVDHQSEYLDEFQQEDNDSPYMHETADLLKNLFQTDRVIAYNARVRGSPQ
jgi:hypothetical protein